MSARNRSDSISICRTSSIRTPMSARICASAFAISRCASCTFCCGRAPWSRSPAATARSMNCLTLSQTRKVSPVPVILVGEAYWRRVFDADFLVAQGTIEPEDRDLFWYAETAADIWRDILLWYELKGEPLLPPDAADEFCRPGNRRR